MTLISDVAMNWFSGAMIVGVCGVTLGIDVYRLAKALREPSGPVVRDRIFGAVIGIVCVSIGLIGFYLHARAAW